ncbi:MAG: DcaP family trimeric outer membrane transporter [Halioglobus sp.]
MYKLKPIAAALFSIGLLGASSIASADAVDDRIAELEKQIAELKSLVTSNQQSIVSNQTEIVGNQTEIEEVRPSKKGTKFQYGGYIQLDALTTDYAEGKPGSSLIEDFFVPSLIPVEPSVGSADSYTSTNIHAKSSRFFFTTKTDTDAGAISTRIELDFLLSGHGDERISNSWNSRLRHAFVKWDYDEGKSLLAGQSWSTFFNVGALPDLLDFVGPVGTLFMRQPQVRWTLGNVQLSAENPATRLNEDIGGSNTTRLDDAETIPDLIARYNGKAGNLNWSAAGMARQLSYDDRSASNSFEVDSDEQYGYALSLAGKWNLGDDDLRFMFSYGDALGRYLGLNSFNDGYISDTGAIETIDQMGGFIAYQHHWTPRWRSTFSVSASEADNPSLHEYSAASSLAKSYQSMHANLNWLPAPKLQLGGELIYGKKEMEDGREGDISRLQFAVKYAF